MAKPKISVGGIVLSSEESCALRRIIAGEVRHLHLRLALAERIHRLMHGAALEGEGAETTDEKGQGKLRVL